VLLRSCLKKVIPAKTLEDILETFSAVEQEADILKAKWYTTAVCDSTGTVKDAV
jgi:hypothetical protein